jgi:hypothetical protein
MTTERDPSGLTDTLSDEAARRLLARASEIAAAESTELSVLELRNVAREAGIPATAFERALAELRAHEPVPVTNSAAHSVIARAQRWALIPALLLTGLVAASFWLRLFQ